MSAPYALAPLLTHGGAPQMVVGAGAAARAMPRIGSREHGMLLIDARILDRHPQLGSRMRRVFRVDPDTACQDGLLEKLATEIGQDDSERGVDGVSLAPGAGHIVGIGGGSVLDAAKLLRLRLLSASSFRTARQGARSFGVSMLPDTWGRSASRLTLMPSTLGTGSEVSAVACLHDDDQGGRSRRLVVGSLMRADTVVLDTVLTGSLDDGAVREGAAEILLRLIGGFVGSPARRVPDAAAEELVARVCGAAAIGVREGFTASLRETLALASAETHTGWALVGRSPFGAKHWYLANELSSAAGLRKVPVTLGLLPAIWQRIVDGDGRLGDADRLRRLWCIVARVLALPDDPVRGAAEWARAWEIAVPLIAADVARTAARRCSEIWGGRRPALQGLTEADIAAIYAAAPPAAPTVEPSERKRKEVNR